MSKNWEGGKRESREGGRRTSENREVGERKPGTWETKVGLLAAENQQIGELGEESRK